MRINLQLKRTTIHPCIDSISFKNIPNKPLKLSFKNKSFSDNKVMANHQKNHLIQTLVEDLHPLMVKNGFICEDNKIDSNDKRIKIVYKFKSLKFKDRVVVEMIGVPLMSFAMDCVAFVPLLVIDESPLIGINTVNIRLNWMKETKQMIFNKFNQFINKLILILSNGINDLPQELQFKILDYLHFKSVIQLSQTNRFWSRFCNQNTIWKKLFRQHFSVNAFNEALKRDDSSIECWKQSFAKEYLRCRRLRPRPLMPSFNPIIPQSYDPFI
jgi:hypothetical protein